MSLQRGEVQYRPEFLVFRYRIMDYFAKGLFAWGPWVLSRHQATIQALMYRTIGRTATQKLHIPIFTIECIEEQELENFEQGATWGVRGAKEIYQMSFPYKWGVTDDE